MRYLFMMIFSVTFFAGNLNANNTVIIQQSGFSCFEFANAVDGELGDGGDNYEVWSNAFEFCCNSEGIETVELN